jgi:ubiquinone/menaquinone biosynthesis C-methylase UbiE
VPNYQEIFDERGRLYHQAMESCPGYRAEEFRAVLQEAGISPGMTVVDVPSGGAYLADYLPGVTLLGLESSLAFAELAQERTETVLLYENDTFPLASECADRVLSIAGLHHVEEKRRVFAEMRRVLSPDGRVVVADAAADSPVRRFLDEFVGAYTDTGHSGW